MAQGRKKGTRKTGGRKKGTPNKVTTEARGAANALVDDPVYRAKLLSDLRKRKVHPTIESMLWYYAKGKPKEHLEHSGDLTLNQPTEDRLKRLSDEDLAAALEHSRAAVRIINGGTLPPLN